MQPLVIWDSFKRFRHTYRNYLSVIYHMTKNQSLINVTFRDGYSTLLPNRIASIATFFEPMQIGSENFVSTLMANQVYYENKLLTLSGIIEEGEIGFIFGRKGHDWLKVENRVVFDVGASIGDSSVFFALKNAQKVIALEPFAKIYKYLNTNIEANNLHGIVIPIMAGYGTGEPVRIEPEKNKRASVLLNDEGTGIIINTYNFKQLFETFNVDSAVLKMDCEGCEYNIIQEDNNTIAKFEQIMMEFHFGDRGIVKKLKEAGFQVESRKYFGGTGGMIRAIRV